MGNLNEQNWKELWSSLEAEAVRKKVRCCDHNCWMIGSVSPAMHKYIWKPAAWVLVHKVKALFSKHPYSMYENKICRDYRDGKITKEELDKCSTCDMYAAINDGLSATSKEQLRNKTGEEIVDADIPVYNVENYLNRCITSVIEQTYKNIEVIIVDDGSTDSSGMQCDLWASKDHRIRVIHQANSGVSTARNVGLKTSVGNAIVFFDPDDEVEKEMIEDVFFRFCLGNHSCAMSEKGRTI